VRDFSATGPVRDASFFPDSARIAVSAGPEGHAHIFILDLVSGRTDQLTNGVGEEINPAVSPEGSSLAFTRSRDGTEQIWVQNLQSGRSRQLTGGQCNSMWSTPAGAAWSQRTMRSLSCVQQVREGRRLVRAGYRIALTNPPKAPEKIYAPDAK
jgi:Tol biopolymer transport system component